MQCCRLSFGQVEHVVVQEVINTECLWEFSDTWSQIDAQAAGQDSDLKRRLLVKMRVDVAKILWLIVGRLVIPKSLFFLDWFGGLDVA